MLLRRRTSGSTARRSPVSARASAAIAKPFLSVRSTASRSSSEAGLPASVRRPSERARQVHSYLSASDAVPRSIRRKRRRRGSTGRGSPSRPSLCAAIAGTCPSPCSSSSISPSTSRFFASLSTRLSSSMASEMSTYSVSCAACSCASQHLGATLAAANHVQPARRRWRGNCSGGIGVSVAVHALRRAAAFTTRSFIARVLPRRKMTGPARTLVTWAREA
jgi:hypothetical protein